MQDFCGARVTWKRRGRDVTLTGEDRDITQGMKVTFRSWKRQGNEFSGPSRKKHSHNSLIFFFRFRIYKKGKNKLF